MNREMDGADPQQRNWSQDVRITNRETTIAGFLVWGILSILILIVLLSPFVLPSDMLFNLSASCQIRNHGRELCCMCGMTKAFIAISEGNIRQARMIAGKMFMKPDNSFAAGNAG